MTDSYKASSNQLRQFVEVFEVLEGEKKDIADQQKEVIAEVKAAGYDAKAFRRVISDRKKTPDELAEEEAVLEMYRQALGMA